MVETLGPSVCEDRPGVTTTTISLGQQRTATVGGRSVAELPTIYHAPMVDGAKPVTLRSVDQAYGSEHLRRTVGQFFGTR